MPPSTFPVTLNSAMPPLGTLGWLPPPGSSTNDVPFHLAQVNATFMVSPSGSTTWARKVGVVVLTNGRLAPDTHAFSSTVRPSGLLGLVLYVICRLKSFRK